MARRIVNLIDKFDKSDLNLLDLLLDQEEQFINECKKNNSKLKTLFEYNTLFIS